MRDPARVGEPQGSSTHFFGVRAAGQGGRARLTGVVRLRALALCVLVAGVVANCGGGGSSTTSSTTSAVTQTLGMTTASSATTTTSRTSVASGTTTRTTTRTTTTRTRTTTQTRTRAHRSASHTTTTLVAPTRAQLGMALCERNVAQHSNVLTSAERSQLDSLCRGEWTGHLTPSAFAAAQRRLCVTMVADSGLVGAAATASERTCPHR